MRFVLTLLIFVGTSCCVAQQIPDLEPDNQDQTAAPGFLACDDDECEIELRRFKKQALQRVSLAAGWMGDLDGGRGLRSSYLDASLESGIPLGSFDNIIGVKPRFRVDWIDAELTVDIPSELYQFELQFFYRRPIHDRLSMIGIFSPSIRSDLKTSDNAFRVSALALLNWECIRDRIMLSAGAVYLGRADLPVLPALGLSWTPSRIAKLDLRFPSSRLSYRLAKSGGESEKWAYLSAGLGGNTWAVSRSSSLSDELSLRDFRLTLGIEKLVDGGGGWFAESGYAFNRKLEYEIDDKELNLGDAVVFRSGWSY